MTEVIDQNLLPLAQLDHWAKLYAAQEKTQAQASKQQQWLVFKLGEELFTVLMSELDEISVSASGSSLPHTQHALLGVIGVRGEPVLLADLGLLLSMRSTPIPSDDQRILIFKDPQGRKTGFLVDRLLGVKDLAETQFQADAKHQAGFVAGVAELRQQEVCRSVSRINVNFMLAQVNG